jgi:hypothetical protein
LEIWESFLKNNSGNILFIILIAVALFAALSYAVTKSNNIGTNNATQETSTINGAVLAQYTASIRAALQRMTTDGKPLFDVEFNPPSDLASLTTPAAGVFHSSGGGVIYQTAPSVLIDIQGDNPTGQWIFSFNFEIANVGSSAASSLDGNDLVAFQVGIKKDVCIQINKKLGLPIAPIPWVDHNVFSSDMIADPQTYYIDNDYTLPTAEHVLGADVENAPLIGKSEGCFWEDESDNYVYYSVISER